MTGQTILAIGKAKLRVKLRENSILLNFKSLSIQSKPAIGLQTYEKLNLVKIVAALDTQWDTSLELHKKM